MGFPVESVTVVTSGVFPASSAAGATLTDPLLTCAASRPTPPTTGKDITASTTAATTPNTAKRALLRGTLTHYIYQGRCRARRVGTARQVPRKGDQPPVTDHSPTGT